MLKITEPITAVSVVPPSVHNVRRVNSIKTRYKQQRQESKAPTFALTYQGTYKTLMTNCGFSQEVAKGIEASYRTLYKVSIDWVNSKLEQATKDGYITGCLWFAGPDSPAETGGAGNPENPLRSGSRRTDSR